MNGFFDFAADSKVHDTVLVTMVISSFLAAIRRFKDETIKAVGGWKRAAMIFWNFLYDWATGFWSMKQGQPVHPIATQQLETHTDGAVKDVTLTTSIESPSPLAQPEGPAQPKK